MKYLARNPIGRFTLAGGFAKLTKLGQGAMDLHSRRSQVDFEALAELAGRLGHDPQPVARANTAMQALTLCGADLAQAVADRALMAVRDLLPADRITSDVIVVDRAGMIIARAGP